MFCFSLACPVHHYLPSLIFHSIGGNVAVFWWIWISWDIIWAELPMLPCIIYWKGRNSLFILWLLNLLTLGIVPMSSEVLFWIRDVSFLFCCFINHSCLCIMLRIIDQIVYLFLIDSFGLLIDFCDSHFLFFCFNYCAATNRKWWQKWALST